MPLISYTPLTQTNIGPTICATPLMEARTHHPNHTVHHPFSTTVTQHVKCSRHFTMFSLNLSHMQQILQEKVINTLGFTMLD